MTATSAYLLGAPAELAACLCCWNWRRSGGIAWLIAGVAALAGFIAVFAGMDIAETRRGFAIFLSLYIVARLAWRWCLDRRAPPVVDIMGASAMLLVMGLLLFGRL